MNKSQSLTKAAWGLSLIAASSLLCASAEAQVQRERGPYLGAGAGVNFQEQNRFPIGGTSSYEIGPVGVLSLGYAFGNGLRLEIEPGYRYNDIDKIGGAPGGGGGRSQILSTMANVLWDFDSIRTLGVPLVPHIGAGVGWAHIWDQEGQHDGLQVKGKDDTVAYQAIAGVEYTYTPRLKLGLDYRYFTAQDAAFRVNNAAGPLTKVGDFNDHAILFTVRYSFGAPPPAPVAVPPAAPAPAPAALPHDYTVYFDFDRSDITPDARPIIQRAAGDAKAGNVTRISVTGHTDRAGPANYNQRLSVRRANAVKAELIRDGVPADEIATVGVGENDLAVPTPDGVREPRNRRVVIELQGAGA